MSVIKLSSASALLLLLSAFSYGDDKITYNWLPLDSRSSAYGAFDADGAYDSKASHQLISAKGATAGIPPRKSAGVWKKGHPRNEVVQVMRKEGLAHWKKISVSPSLADRDGDVSVQAVAGGENQSAKIQRPSGGSYGVCKRHKQAEYSGSTCQITPSVTVTWG